jgi:hypothetical protein
LRTPLGATRWKNLFCNSVTATVRTCDRQTQMLAGSDVPLPDAQDVFPRHRVLDMHDALGLELVTQDVVRRISRPGLEPPNEFWR